MMNNEYSLVFTGDVAFSGHFKGKYANVLDDKINAFLHAADDVVVNVEAPVTNTQISSSRLITHVNNTECVETLKNMNSRIWNLANNHILDCGETGMNDSIHEASQNGIVPLGVNGNYSTIQEVNGIRVGIISMTQAWKHLVDQNKNRVTLFWNDTFGIQKQISILKETCDWIILVVHGGDEFLSIPLPETRKLYHSLLDLGADIIIGHHPHVVQNYEKVGNKMIFYSLGNFIFDTDYQRMQRHTQFGMLVKIKFTKQNYTWESISTEVNRDLQIVQEGKDNPIFTNLSEKSYQQLWPLAASLYVKADRKAKLSLHPETKKMKLLIKEIKACKYDKGRLLMYARIVSLLKLYQLSNKKEVIQYLINEN